MFNIELYILYLPGRILHLFAVIFIKINSYVYYELKKLHLL